MIDLMDRYLQRLIREAGAEAAVIWSRIGDAAAGSVICSHPLGLLPPAAAWPTTDPSLSEVIHRDPATVASLVPTSVRLELPAPPTAALSLELADPDLVLLLIWSSPPLGEQLPDGLRLLVVEEISYTARFLSRQSRFDRETQRLHAVVGDLKQGVVSVDHSVHQVTVNPAAAKLLNLASGEVDESEFAAAMAELEARAINRDDVTSMGRRLLADPGDVIDCTWHFDGCPSHVQVSSHAVRQGAFSGRIWVFEDVSEAARALAASQATQMLLQANADSMLNPNVLFETVRDPGGRITDFRYRSANQATYTYLGVSEQALIGASALATLPNLESSGLLACYVNCVETGEPVVLHDFSYFNEIIDHHRRYDIQATRAGPDLLSLTWSDVTDRFHTAQRIAESEQNYRLLAENIGDVVAIMRGGKFAWVSPSIEGVLGAPPAYWIGREVRDIIPADRLASHADRMQRLAARGVIQERSQVKAVDGRLLWIQLTLKTLLDADGRPDGYTASFRVIDDEVAAEQAAEEARKRQAEADARFRRSMDNAAVGMCLTTPEGRFTDVNEAMCHFFGYDEATLTQMTWQELTEPDYLEADVINVEKILAGQMDSYRLTKMFIHADGRPIWGDLSVSCLRSPSGEVERFIAQITDMTTEVTLAQRLQQQSDRMTAELRSAAAYMSSILPSGLSGVVDVTSRYLPSRELGGDCFDYTWIDEDHLLVYLIDVSGHGLEPALLSVSIHNMLRSGSLAIETMLSPADAVSELNRLFQMEDQGDHYFTIWYGVYKPSTRTLRYVNAGCPAALAFTSLAEGTPETTELTSPSTPVGMFEDAEFSSCDYSVPPGCRILIYSDGASEITLGDGRQLSPARFLGVVTTALGSSTSSLDDLIAELRAKTANGLFEDDFSMIRMAFD